MGIIASVCHLCVWCSAGSVICCYGNIAAYLLLWCPVHFITFVTIINTTLWVARLYFKKELSAHRLMSVWSKWPHISKFEWVPPLQANKDLLCGKNTFKPSWEVCVQKHFFLSYSFNFELLLLPPKAYWPWPPCNVWCLHCHNSSWLLAECVSIACWCVLHSGKVSERGRGRRQGGHSLEEISWQLTHIYDNYTFRTSWWRPIFTCSFISPEFSHTICWWELSLSYQKMMYFINACMKKKKNLSNFRIPQFLRHSLCSKCRVVSHS